MTVIHARKVSVAISVYIMRTSVTLSHVRTRAPALILWILTSVSVIMASWERTVRLILMNVHQTFV